jgi:hypothetical protein
LLRFFIPFGRKEKKEMILSYFKELLLTFFEEFIPGSAARTDPKTLQPIMYKGVAVLEEKVGNLK